MAPPNRRHIRFTVMQCNEHDDVLPWALGVIENGMPAHLNPNDQANAANGGRASVMHLCRAYLLSWNKLHQVHKTALRGLSPGGSLLPAAPRRAARPSRHSGNGKCGSR